MTKKQQILTFKRLERAHVFHTYFSSLPIHFLLTNESLQLSFSLEVCQLFNICVFCCAGDELRSHDGTLLPCVSVSDCSICQNVNCGKWSKAAIKLNFKSCTEAAKVFTHLCLYCTAKPAETSLFYSCRGILI